MDEQEFKQKLLKEITRHKSGQTSEEEFISKLQELSKRVEPKQISDFEDEEIGWAKTWIDEIPHYGLKEVMQNRFDFFKLIEPRSEGS